MPKKQKLLRVGFDMDGVLLYNPARVARPIIYTIKTLFFKKEVNKFHYPKTPLQKFVWRLLHKSSLWPAAGVKNIHRLVREKKIKAYIITARYEFLKDDFQDWLKRIEAGKYFENCYFNRGDEQPNEFKARKIRELKLDIFVEDNWDIVKKLRQIGLTYRQNSKRNQTKIFWISNMLDRNIAYPYKFMSLRRVLQKIEKLI